MGTVTSFYYNPLEPGLAPPLETPITSYTQLMPDGRVIMLINDRTACFALTPDKTGSYANGTWSALPDAPYTMKFGCTGITNDGKVVFWGGEYGTSLFLGAMVFDPASNTWTTYPASQLPHQPVTCLDDGRFISGNYIINSSGIPSDRTTNPSPFAFSESSPALQPDGRLVQFQARQGGSLDASSGIWADQIWVIRPTYSSPFVSAGSFNGDGTAVRLSKTAQVTALGNDGRGSGVEWCSTGPAGTVNYEIGPSGYMNKIGKTVLVGGNGFIYTYDLATDTLARPAKIGMANIGVDKDSPAIIGRIQLSTATAAGNIVAGGTLNVLIEAHGNADADGWASYMLSLNQSTTLKKIVCLLTNSSPCGFVPIRYSSMSYNSVTKVMTFTGLSYPTDLYPAITPSVFSGTVSPNVDLVVFGRPTRASMDACGAFLPNGDLIFSAAAESSSLYTGDFPYFSAWCKWDGTSSEATFVSDSMFTMYNKLCFMLPDGTLFMQHNNNETEVINGVLQHATGTPRNTLYRFYIPDVAESTPPAGGRPTITSFPASVERGSSVTLTGTQLNGLNEGGMFGDDGSPKTNFPVVRLTSKVSGDVYYCRTYNYTYRGIQPSRTSSCSVYIPGTLPNGAYSVTVVANGVPSASQDVVVTTAFAASEQAMFALL